jgi:hypothetical protein
MCEPEIFDRTVEVTTWAELRNAVIGAVAGQRTQIIVMNDLEADLPVGVLTVAADRDITITSNGNTAFVLKRYAVIQRHFTVNGVLRLRNIELHGDYPDNTANHGGILVNSTGHVYLEAGSVITKCRNTAANQAGAVAVIGGMLTVNGGHIVNNSAFTDTRLADPSLQLPLPANAGMAGGILARNGATVTINSGSVSSNEGRFGGAIIINSTNDFAVADTRVIINGGIFDNNLALFGGAVNVERGTLEINGGIIGNNTVTALANPPSIAVSAGRGGGGVFLQNAAHVTMRGGSINNNTSISHGGGVMITAGTVFDMIDGEIVDNTASGSGNEVWTVGTGIFNHTGGTVGRNG